MTKRFLLGNKHLFFLYCSDSSVYNFLLSFFKCPGSGIFGLNQALVYFCLKSAVKKKIHEIVQSFIALWYNKYFISNNSRCAKDNKHIHSFILFKTLDKHVNI